MLVTEWNVTAGQNGEPDDVKIIEKEITPEELEQLQGMMDEDADQPALHEGAGMIGDAGTFIALFGDLHEVVVVPFSLDTPHGRFECQIEQISADEATRLTNKAWRGRDGKLLKSDRFASQITRNTATCNVQRCVVRLVEKDGKEATEPIFTMEQVGQLYDSAKMRPFFEALENKVSEVNLSLAPLNLDTPQ